MEEITRGVALLGGWVGCSREAHNEVLTLRGMTWHVEYKAEY
jgi:hypothetical protein